MSQRRPVRAAGYASIRIGEVLPPPLSDAATEVDTLNRHAPPPVRVEPASVGVPLKGAS